MSHYADIHHFKADNKTGLTDDEGDSLSGWYFQIMVNEVEAASDLTGPYYSKQECETAVLQEWGA